MRTSAELCNDARHPANNLGAIARIERDSTNIALVPNLQRSADLLRELAGALSIGSAPRDPGIADEGHRPGASWPDDLRSLDVRLAHVERTLAEIVTAPRAPADDGKEGLRNFARRILSGP